MKKLLLYFYLFFKQKKNGSDNEKVFHVSIVYGQIITKNGLAVPYSVLFINGEAVGYSKEDGSFALNLPKGEYILEAKGNGIVPKKYKIKVNKDILKYEVVVSLSGIDLSRILKKVK